MKVLVIGGGVIGISVARAVAQRDHAVTLVDAATFEEGTSHGNAGLLCPSYATPLATPAALLSAIAALSRRNAPFRLAGRFDVAFLRWLALFLIACRRAAVRANSAALLQLALESIDLHAEFARTAGACGGYARNGWLYVYRSASGLKEGLQHARDVGAAGVISRTYGPAEALAFEPALRTGVAGAVFYPEDAQVDPHAYVQQLASAAREAGVTFIGNTSIAALVAQRGRVTSALGANGPLYADAFVLCAGSWSAKLAATLGLRLPIQPAKGYSLSFQSSSRPQRPLMLGEAHVVMTPLPAATRMTSGLELGTFDRSSNAAQMNAMSAAARTYLWDVGGLDDARSWVGFRPLTPDGLPIIGPSRRYPNLVLAAGHGTLGMTLAPVTGRIVADALVSGRSAILPAAVAPRRFSI